VNGIRSVAVAVIGLALAAALVGCSDDEPAAAPKATVLAPGKPGEPNQTLTVGPTSPRPPVAEEITFVQMMIPHHQQALEMASLAPKQAANAQVKALAERIEAGQGAEISAMQSWLRKHGKTPAKHGAHGGSSATPHTMPGMATPAQLKQLQAAQGAEFDRLFLNLMITHHHGALTMAQQALGKGGDVVVQELAKDVVISQQGEINRMRDILAGL
jgi:uncharacterized protein (DUF305 family)